MVWGIALLLLALSQGTTVRAADESAGSNIVMRPRASFMVPLRQRDRPTWRRHLLRNGALSVEGSVREVGYFYTTLQLGTPARHFSVIIDTGSTITYIPCKGCSHCGKHQDEWFDPDASSTANKLSCTDPLCDCGTPNCQCNDSRCYYLRTYAERSSSEGWMIEDVFGFPDEQPPVKLVFGCENGESGEIYRQMADGIMGMGNNHNAFQSQLVARGVIEDVFSLCFGYPRDGILLLGDVPLPAGAQTVYTPLLSNLHLHYYNVKMEGITVDGSTLQLDAGMFDRGYGVVLDSGTTFTYLPTEAFQSMAQAIGKYAEAHGLQSTPGSDPQYNDVCWKGAPESFDELHRVFPPAEFVFGGNARLSLPPVRYLFLSGRPGEYCLGFFDNGGAGTLIGGVSVRDVLLTYDRRNSRVGFTSIPCADVAGDIASRPRGGANVTVLGSLPPPKPATSAAKTDSSPPKSTPAPSASPEAPKVAEPEDSEEGPEGVSQGPGTAAPAVKKTDVSYNTTQAAGSHGSINYWVLCAVVLMIVAMFVVAELMFFRRTVLVTIVNSMVMRARGAQDETEMAPLSGTKSMAGP